METRRVAAWAIGTILVYSAACHYALGQSPEDAEVERAIASARKATGMVLRFNGATEENRHRLVDEWLAKATVEPLPSVLFMQARGQEKWLTVSTPAVVAYVAGGTRVRYLRLLGDGLAWVRKHPAHESATHAGGDAQIEKDDVRELYTRFVTDALATRVSFAPVELSMSQPKEYWTARSRQIEPNSGTPVWGKERAVYVDVVSRSIVGFWDSSIAEVTPLSNKLTVPREVVVEAAWARLLEVLAPGAVVPLRQSAEAEYCYADTLVQSTYETSVPYAARYGWWLVWRVELRYRVKRSGSDFFISGVKVVTVDALSGKVLSDND